MKPLILHSELTKTWYVVTRYTQQEGHVTAHTKYDVTDQVLAIHTAILERVEQAEAKVKELESRVAGKVLVKPCVGPAWGGFEARLPDCLFDEDGNGMTEAEAIENLQVLIDEVTADAHQPGRA